MDHRGQVGYSRHVNMCICLLLRLIWIFTEMSAFLKEGQMKKSDLLITSSCL